LTPTTIIVVGVKDLKEVKKMVDLSLGTINELYFRQIRELTLEGCRRGEC